MPKRAVLRINQRSVEALKPDPSRPTGRWFADRDLPGFNVVIYRTGDVAYVVRYRVHGVRRSIRLGHHPVVTAWEARKEAIAILGGAARGRDELEQRERARDAATEKHPQITFRTWRRDYVDAASRRLMSTRDPERYLAIAGMLWDSRPLCEITVSDVEALRDRIAREGTGWAAGDSRVSKHWPPRARVGGAQANRFLANVRAAFSHAVRLGHVESNPAARVPLLRESPPRSLTLSPHEERRLRVAVKAHREPFVRAAFTLLLDTGARLSEVLRARWEDFDLPGATWRIPSPKAGRPQAVPLLRRTVQVLKKTPRLEGVSFVIPGPGRVRVRRDLKKPWNLLRTSAGISADVTIHDLRRTFGLRATRVVGIFGASKLLRHSDSRVTERVYAPLAPEDLREYAVRVDKACPH